MLRGRFVCHALVCAIIWLSQILLYLYGSTYVQVCTTTEDTTLFRSQREVRIYILSKIVDLSFSVHKLAKFSSNPGKLHFEGLVHLLIYIRDNKTLGLLDILVETSCLYEHVRTYMYVDPSKYSRIRDSHIMAQTSA